MKIDAFPVTLTLSLGEREQQSRISRLSNARPVNPVAGSDVSLATIPPLPGGEGRGEGERRTNSI